MKNHKLSLLTFVTSLAIAAVAAWYSIIGLTAIFAAAVIPIIIMGIVLEIGKLVAAAWVYNHWRETSILLRTYLVSAIVVLMLITSMGIYGFLSKSHIDAGINTGEISVKIERVDNRIKSEQRQIDRAEKNILEMDTTLDKTSYGFFDDSRLDERKRQSVEREQLNNIITKSENSIDDLLDKKSEYELEVKNFEVEVGPIKYIAALIYGDEAKNYLDNTVRYVILLLIFVFDPLAVLLLISANMSYRKELGLYPPEEKGLPVNVGKTIRSATTHKGVKKVTKERDGVKIHFFEEDDGKG
jgi:hypothetical protein|tara:strand:+ start:854 stop:1750 length:897 start_codon:yes stop_codon:yes gene_type:complete